MDLHITTSRLTLAPFGAEDVDIAIEMFTDPGSNYTGSVMGEDEVRKHMPDWVRRGGNGCLGIWCVANSETGEKLGTVALLPMPIEDADTDFELLKPDFWPDSDIEIGYYLKRSSWGNGYATEAASALIDRVFKSESLSEICATFDSTNSASRNVLNKCGFVDLGERECYGTTGHDFRITRDDWRRANNQ